MSSSGLPARISPLHSEPRRENSLTIAITCHGCGKCFEVPDDYERRKVRCAECGVYCDLPEPAKKTGAARPSAEPAKKTSAGKPVTKPASKPSLPVPKAGDVFTD